jgi:hypothetical protein
VMVGWETGSVEVGGSIPTGSTKFFKHLRRSAKPQEPLKSALN